ncbi:hypothetical protein BBJ28_00001336 [Nothophytophthora sp. Chile5]|nr:hypothetical protein BBJ28_00001336 [Nothophytophthora sp. Chile5]
MVEHAPSPEKRGNAATQSAACALPSCKAEKLKANQISPEGLIRALTRRVSVSSTKIRTWTNFYSAFGLLGPPLLSIVLISIAWTTWLVVLTLAPNATANYLMDTAEYDDGQFWMIMDPEIGLKVLSTIGLVTVDGYYLFIFWKLITARTKSPLLIPTKVVDADGNEQRGASKRSSMIHTVYDRLLVYCRELLGIRGVNRKFWKMVDLSMQGVMLHQLLEEGFSVQLVLGFDLVAAVLYPILVLLYSYNRFDFDREVFNIYWEFLPRGSFERSARLFADPGERALFIASLNSLRILSYMDLGLRLSMNLSFCLRLANVIALLLRTRGLEKLQTTRGDNLRHVFLRQRRVPKPVALLFIGFAAAVIFYTKTAIASSEVVCSPHPECVVYAFQWAAGDSCPCRTLVDVYTLPRTFEEWITPVDVFAKVQTLSRAGELQNMQLINRALRRWPEELRNCTNLQYIHIEGKQLRPTLTQLPDDLFSDMPFLRLLHLGVHPTLKQVPPFVGVPHLRSLTLACLISVVELPSFQGISELQRLELPYMVALRTLPDLTPLQRLTSFSLFSMCMACCNGFMGDCDLTNPFCLASPLTNDRPATCLSDQEARATAGSQLIFRRFAASTCLRSGFDQKNVEDVLSQDRIEMCGGVRFRRCEYPPASGQFGICINNRLQVLSCVVNDDYVKMRKVQIERNHPLSEIVPLEQPPVSLKGRGDRLLPRKTAPTHHLAFWQAFGLLGIPMMLVLSVSIAWTAWLILLMLTPNQMANLLMNTGEYDDGQFWQIVEQDSLVKGVNVAGLALIEVFNLYLLAKMLVWRIVEDPVSQVWRSLLDSTAGSNPTMALRGKNQVALFWKELTGIHGKYRKFWVHQNLGFKGVDLIMQTILLNEILEQGSPVLLVYGFAAFISANSLSCVVTTLLAKHSALSEILWDSVFDLIAAVVYPILVLVYCYHHFEFDREVYRINMEVLPPGSFERTARMLADPSQVALFRVNFDSLRLQTPLLFVLRMAMNLSFCHRFKSVINVLIRIRRRVIYPKRPTAFKLHPQKLVPKSVALVFVVYSVLILPFAYKAIETTQSACSPYTECKVHAYRYFSAVAGAQNCPCRVLIDMNRAPRTFDEWIHPVDVTENVKALAAAGDLNVLRLINRQLLELPTELQNCRDLKHISLIYTSTITLPDWAKHWTKLEYLHVEGKQGSANLLSLPSDLFSNMPSLSFLHLALHFSLDPLPSFDGAHNLQSLVLAHLFALREVPSFAKTLGLERIQIVYLPRLQTLPDISQLPHLANFAVYRTSFLCCNGFLGNCDLTHPFCDADPVHGLPAATCLESEALRASPAMLNKLQQFNKSVCIKTADNLLQFADIPTKTSVDECAKTQPAMTENPTTSHCPKAADPKLALNGILPINSASVGATAPPIGPSSALSNEEFSKAISAYPLSFWQAFGLLGIPMLFLLLICIGWTAWLIGLTLKPNEAANLLMDTGGYDSGLFWLIVENTTAVKAANVAGLLAIECFYLYLLAKLLVWRTVENLLLKAVDLTVETIALYGFDLVAAVGYPLLILGYCHHNFSFDHKVYALYERVIRPNSFDNVGRLFADQSAMALFRLSFDSLRLRSPLGLFLCVSMNLSFCTRHIEGQPGGPSLKSLPGDLFEDMPALTVICLSQHRGLESLPTLAGAPNLRSLVLASLPLLKELPSSFDKVPQVVQLVLFYLPQLERLPDMAPLVNLADFAVIKPSHICCNGFLSTCDQSDSFCVEDLAQSVPEATCLKAKDTANRATEATINVFRRFASSVCHQASFITGVGDPPPKERTEICGYSLFRRCEYPPNSGHFGMCMPYRMQVLSCTLNDDFIQFRHLQDTELGMPCNPIEEAWLGCTI